MEELEQSRLSGNFMALAGMVKALEYGIRMLIETHPDRERLSLAWQAVLPVIADAHTSGEVSEPEAFQQGLQSVLGRLTQQVELHAIRGSTPPR